jgi:hypothetical protein
LKDKDVEAVFGAVMASEAVSFFVISFAAGKRIFEKFVEIFR